MMAESEQSELEQELDLLWAGPGSADLDQSLTETWAVVDALPPDQEGKAGPHPDSPAVGKLSPDQERLLLGAAAILSPTRAAELLPMREADGIRWLREQHLIHDLHGKEVVVWQEVIDRIGQPQQAPNNVNRRSRASKASLPRYGF